MRPGRPRGTMRAWDAETAVAKIEELAGKKEPSRPASDPAMMQALQAQLEQRDKKIEELTNQLEALKRIDQEMREKARPARPPAPPAPLPLEGESKP